jgi:hypothetical protein
MKIILIGFFALAGWSVVATNFFVCRIKGLCDDQETIEISLLKQGDVVSKRITGLDRLNNWQENI